ncbi:MAG: cation transporter [Ktedonobacterales bacterium]|nr:cation transporter [Ktedonobacterales bacterium]
MNSGTLLQRGLWLEYVTLGWNVIGLGIVLWAAVLARSVALAGFGLDSLIEIFASVVVIWQLRGVNAQRERMALRRIALAFGGLVGYILIQLIVTLLTRTHPQPSFGGALWLTLTLGVMLLLATGKRLTGQQLGNAVLQTEARVTLVDAYLAGAVLLGLLLNARLGWWWADPAASLVIVYYGAREARHAWHEADQL